ncbi:hypothetical protein ABGB09_29575 [Streptomyces sp. B8F3]|uniref:hypothetical protein n=1 Tax=Streptomyces sp. B8F3 TaxID=3153573 RepID=UPI00325E6F72
MTATPTTPPRARGFTIALPAGLPLLNANQRLHHHQRARHTATLRAAATAAVANTPGLRAALAAAKPGPLFQRAHILGVLHPHDRRRRDPANYYPSFKAAIDGLVDTGLLDDDDHTHLIGPDMRIGHVVTGGRLVLHIRDLTEHDAWPDPP